MDRVLAVLNSLTMTVTMWPKKELEFSCVYDAPDFWVSSSQVRT